METLHWIAHALVLLGFLAGEVVDVDGCAHGEVADCAEALRPLAAHEARGP